MTETEILNFQEAIYVTFAPQVTVVIPLFLTLVVFIVFIKVFSARVDLNGWLSVWAKLRGNSA